MVYQNWAFLPFKWCRGRISRILVMRRKGINHLSLARFDILKGVVHSYQGSEVSGFEIKKCQANRIKYWNWANRNK